MVITDKLLSSPPALRRVLPNVDHRRHTGLNNRADNSHPRARQRERLMRRFKSAQPAQRLLDAFGAIGDHFRVGYRTVVATRRQLLVERHSSWTDVVSLRIAA
jgi:putative transposase